MSEYNKEAKEAQLLEQAEAVMARALKAGADQAEIHVSRGQEFGCKYRDEVLDELEEAGSASLGLRLFKDGRVMTATSSDPNPALVDGLIRDLLDAAPLLDADEFAGLAPSENLSTAAHPDLKLFDPNTATDRIEDRLERARAAEAAVRYADPRVSATDGASFSSYYGSSATVASNGLRRSGSGGWQSIGADAICEDEGGKKRNGSWFSVHRHLNGLMDPEELGRIAAARAVARIGAVKPPTGSYPVIWDRLVSPSLLGMLTGCITATSIYRKQTFLAERLETLIASKAVTLTDDPSSVGALGSSAVDGEGRRRQRQTLVKDGVLKRYLAAQYSSNRTGIPCTASANRPLAGTPHEGTTNLSLQPGSRSPEALIADIEEGIFLESTIGFGFNPVTGAFSRGGSGRMIRGGELAEPISEFTISMPFEELLAAVTEVADDLIWDRRIAAPTLRVEEMMVGGAG